MSYLFSWDLTEEFQRIFKEAFPDADLEGVYIHDRDNDRPRHPFTAYIGEHAVKFTVPEDRLHSSPLSYVSRDYLKPLLARMIAEKANKGE